VDGRLVDQRVVIAGAGAAGIGIARLIRLAMLDDGATEGDAGAAIAMVDSRGLVHDGRPDLDADKLMVARSADRLAADGFASDGATPSLHDVVRVLRPTILLGATGMPGTFDEALIRTLAANTPRPIVMPLSNPTAVSEAIPADVLRWSEGRALVATGSPFAAVEVDGRRHEIGQANNVFVFPGLGLGAIVAEARAMPDRLFLVAARTLAEEVGDERLAAGSLYPAVERLRDVTRAIALAVATAAREDGLAALDPSADLAHEVDEAMWWPDYVPYVPVEDRRTADSDSL
jgi:malic enzyme